MAVIKVGILANLFLCWSRVDHATYHESGLSNHLAQLSKGAIPKGSLPIRSSPLHAPRRHANAGFEVAEICDNFVTEFVWPDGYSPIGNARRFAQIPVYGTPGA